MSRLPTILLLCALLLSSAGLAFLAQPRGTRVQVGGNTFVVRLTEFDPPVQLGYKAPPLAKEHEELFGRKYRVMRLATDWSDTKSSEEGAQIAQLLHALPKRRTDEEYADLRKRLDSDPDYRRWYQDSVEYVVEVLWKEQGERYLFYVFSLGLTTQRTDPGQRLPYSPWVWFGGGWVPCPSHDMLGVTVIRKALPVDQLDLMRQVVKTGKVPDGDSGVKKQSASDQAEP